MLERENSKRFFIGLALSARAKFSTTNEPSISSKSTFSISHLAPYSDSITETMRFFTNISKKSLSKTMPPATSTMTKTKGPILTLPFGFFSFFCLTFLPGFIVFEPFLAPLDKPLSSFGFMEAFDAVVFFVTVSFSLATNCLHF